MPSPVALPVLTNLSPWHTKGRIRAQGWQVLPGQVTLCPQTLAPGRAGLGTPLTPLKFLRDEMGAMSSSPCAEVSQLSITPSLTSLWGG